jgi:peptide/nickel transport system permease protein
MSFVIYWLMGLMPGDPIDLMISADPKLTTDDAIRLRALYGLDRPITERYFNWLSAAFAGDFGFSRLHAKPVLNVLWPALSNTIVLLGISFILSLLLALPAGIYAAIRQYSFADYAVNLAAFAGISVPSFWLALLLITLFSVILGILPASGTEIIGAGLTGFWDTAKFLILPIATLAISSIGSHTRFVRAAMIETMRQDYIRTARAKGASETRVVLKHAFRNAMIPVATIIALDFGFLFSGALIVETIFAYPGMGKLIFDAIMGNDFNLAMIAFLFATILTLLGNLIADLAYGWLDPRITTGAADGEGTK